MCPASRPRETPCWRVRPRHSCVEAVLEAGDHGLVIGLVERVELGSDPAPLLYHDRRYHAFKEEA